MLAEDELCANSKAKKMAEIVAGLLAAGDMAIANTAMATEFFDSHEKYGRNL